MDELRIRLRHLENERKVLQAEYDEARHKYIELYFSLEKRVNERTAELAGAHQELLNVHNKLREEQDALVNSRALFRNLFESSPDPIVLLNSDFTVKKINPAGIALFDSIRSATNSGNALDYADPKDRDLIRLIGSRLIRRKLDHIQELFEFTLVDGRTVEVTASHLGNDDQPGYLIHVRDITPRKKTEQALQKALFAAESASRARSEFLANLSHELKTPLNAIIGFSELLVSAEPDSVKKEQLNNINSSGIELLGMLEDLINMAKLETHRLQLTRNFFNPDGFIRETVEEYQSAAAEKDIEIRTSVQTGSIDLYGDEPKLRQCLKHLLDNAVKFTENGRISILLDFEPTIDKPETGTLKLAVSDTGIGIGNEILAQIFEPFRQAEGHSGRRFGGTGLGLAITKGYVELMQGTISVQSQPGKGAHFEIRLPDMTYRAERLTTVPRTDDTASTGAVKKILTADDKELNLKLIHYFLQDTPWKIIQVNTGTQAIDYLLENQVDLLLLDLYMPGPDGIETLLKIRRINKNKDVPAILVTARNDDEIKAQASAAGFDDLLFKPINQQNLIRAIKNIFRKTSTAEKILSASDDYPDSVQQSALIEEYLPRWENLMRRKVIQEIGTFAADLLTFLAESKSGGNLIRSWAEKIQESCAAFDISAINRQLPQFKDLVLQPIKRN